MSTLKELTAIVERQEATIEALLKRIEALEARPAVSPTSKTASAVTKDKAGLVVKVPLDSKVTKAGRTEEGFYLLIDGNRVACTEYAARWWHKRLTTQAA